MRPSVLFVFIVLLLSEAAFSQRSPVFLQPEKAPKLKWHRPKGRITPLNPKSFHQPQTLGTSHSDFPNINISKWFFHDQNETAVAVNPTDAKNIIVGANDYRTFNTLWYFASTDGGFTWKSQELPADRALHFATDPSVGFGPDGVGYYANGRLAHGGSPYPLNDVITYKSTTKGLSWDAPVRVFFDSDNVASASTLADKYYLAVAPTAAGPLPPKLYVAWAEYENEKSRIVISRSQDGGATWSPRVGLTGFGKFQAPIPTVAAGGDVYVTFIDLDTTKREILFAKSTDGAQTFTAPKKIANYNHLGPLHPPGSPHPHPIIKGHLRVNSFPSIAVDHSFKHFNRIYTTWAGKGQDGRHHIYLSKSDDFGTTWSEALPIENDKSLLLTDKFFPWIAVDPTNGDVGICFYDSRLDAPANQMTDLFLGISEDGGESFRVQRVSDRSFNPSVSASVDSTASVDTLSFFGDYNGLAAFNGMWYPVWTDSREGYDQDIYIGIVNPRLPEGVKVLEVQEEAGSHFPVLTWSHSGLTTFGAQLGEHVFRIKRSDSASIDLPSNARTFRDSSAAPATTYTYRVTVIASERASIAQEVRFIPSAVRKPQAPRVVTSRAEGQPESAFFVRFRIPDKNVVGDSIRDLAYLYYLIDGVVADSFKLSDAMRGSELERSFAVVTGYHKFQMAATSATDGEIVSSDTSAALWLYAGQPRETYFESFEETKDIFTTQAWETTSVGLTSVFINDSLPNVPYPSGVDSWMLLPPVRISAGIHTLEFDHMALVAAGDSALIEVSLDNGVSYFFVRRYDITSEGLKWNHTLFDSEPSGDSIALKAHMGNDAIIRFRLSGVNPTGEDGWFIDNIRFTDKLSVEHANASMQSLTIRPSVVHYGSDVRAALAVTAAGHLSIDVADILGRSVGQVFAPRSIPPGEYEIEFPAPASGAYIVTATLRVPGEPVSILRGRFIVRP